MKKEKELQFTDMMIDIETLGTTPGCVILSVAAVPFNMDHHTSKREKTGLPLVLNVSIEDSVKEGFEIQSDTLHWWLNKDDGGVDFRDIFNESHENGASVQFTMEILDDYFQTMGGRSLMYWARSPIFDMGILEYAFNKCDIEIPWNKFKLRDVRTLDAMYPEVRKNIERPKDIHDPKIDCLYQIEYCQRIDEKMKKTI